MQTTTLIVPKSINAASLRDFAHQNGCTTALTASGQYKLTPKPKTPWQTAVCAFSA